ncbi:MAG TPA: CidA/LrgA family protein [Longimicrobiaceae bacterium]|nr:CidA/LrgA family protein [Longimicrobiaceae bacterium]
MLLRTTARGPLRHAAGLAVLLAFYALGEAAARLGRLPLPGSVVGMLLLAAALHLRRVSVSRVEPAAGVLLRHMGLLFVPPGVALMLQYELLRREWLPVVAAGAASTVAVMAAVGWLQQRLEGDG